jgi:hypothetical protein
MSFLAPFPSQLIELSSLCRVLTPYVERFPAFRPERASVDSVLQEGQFSHPLAPVLIGTCSSAEQGQHGPADWLWQRRPGLDETG